MPVQGAVVALANGIGPIIGGALASQSPDSWYVHPNEKVSHVLTMSKAMDIPAEPFHMPLNHWLRHLLYATKKGQR